MSASHNFSAEDIMQYNLKGIQRGLNIIMVELQIDMRLRLSHHGGGRKYVVTKSGTIHQASAAGQPPAVRTGRLRNSVQTDKKNADNSLHALGTKAKGIYGDVVALALTGLVPYARFLEYGTKRMKPRPFIVPSLNAVRPRAQQNISDQMLKSIALMKKRAMKVVP